MSTTTKKPDTNTTLEKEKIMPTTDETLTIHIVQPVGFGNLNRDENGLPKTADLGGTRRGRLSYQSVKRAARQAFERRSGHHTHRTKTHETLIAARAHELNPEISVDKAEDAAKKHLKKLAKDSLRWLSPDEVEAAALHIAEGASGEPEWGKGKTSSLSIAAFGRMMSGTPEAGIDAAVTVTPVIASHETPLTHDFFSAVDDLHGDADTGAGHLGSTVWTSFTGLRQVTINKSQLRRNWTAIDQDTASDQVKMLVEALIHELPTGKTNTSQPAEAPAVVYAVVDGKPGHPRSHALPLMRAVDPDNNGYTTPTIKQLAKAATRMRRQDESVGAVGDHFVTGVADEDLLEAFECDTVTEGDLIDRITDWALAAPEVVGAGE